MSAPPYHMILTHRHPGAAKERRRSAAGAAVAREAGPARGGSRGCGARGALVDTSRYGNQSAVRAYLDSAYVKRRYSHIATLARQKRAAEAPLAHLSQEERDRLEEALVAAARSSPCRSIPYLSRRQDLRSPPPLSH